MRNYRIAFFTADWNYELVESTLHGLKRFADDHENVSVRIFDCFGKDKGTPNDISEYNIFNLADLTKFDGLIVQGNQLVYEPVRNDIARRVVESGIPAISIDCPLEGCATICVDNERAQYEIVEHVLKKHHAKRLVYLTGILGNGCPEGNQRLNGFVTACRDNGIPDENMEIIERTWRTTDGEETAAKWVDSGRPLPDAFICANDEMAFGLMEVLEDRGFRIPGDVIVTGFDNLGSAELSSPRLSTVDRDYERLIYVAAGKLIERIEGTDLRDVIPFNHRLVCSESCGCQSLAQHEYVRSRYYQQTRFLKNFYMLQDRMAEELLEANDLLELMGIVERNHSMFGCESVYLCINDYYYDNYEKKHWHHDSETFGDQMILAACRDCGIDDSHRYARFPTGDLLPVDILRQERFLMFYPLHYNTYCIGYVAMNGISQAAKMNLHRSIFNFVEIAVENVRKKVLLRQLNETLDNLYVQDSLTGFYNRFGFERYAGRYFDRFMAADGAAQVMFIDMDDMKFINDRYGHEMGDLAIRTTADILRATCGDGAFLMRYGGDEFLVIASGRQIGLEQDIQRAVEATRGRADIPFHLSLSVGIVRADAGQSRSLDDCVLAADALMYEVKNKRKSRR